jgi:hypothetical protein
MNISIAHYISNLYDCMHLQLFFATSSNLQGFTSQIQDFNLFYFRFQPFIFQIAFNCSTYCPLQFSFYNPADPEWLPVK